ncbi:5-demethoxyubiquinol-8 5-hydroxylase UbiM [Dyella ginsengisoli]|uniref:5-demethoxyubiquinol-8 5-hydroxylase UbiM n=1 Tax=Dyella ginsengisoli TaxID=363848 RepID=UPI000345ECF6|nr:5-demethoxyubiquinol-8 5-hydroxylase UbiM [Dyella ginsengisoli]
MRVDVAVVGGGPAGLCLAGALADAGLEVVVLERQSLMALAEPADDGREIALTKASRERLEQLGVWPRIDPAYIHPLRAARVMDGRGARPMEIAAPGHGVLGHLVGNAQIRRAAFEAADSRPSVQVVNHADVQDIATEGSGVRLSCAGDLSVLARLAVAADSRFSAMRRLLGIGARMRDFGRSMLVCRMTHEQPHRQEAWEWFGYGQTLALLPLWEGQSSVVLTLPHHLAQAMQDLPPEDFARAMQERFDHRLGAMRLLGERHVYPLVGTYARRFVAPRCALVGDAAVGMHPVTAHGFNFGLQSAETLATHLRGALQSGRDIGSPHVLAAYEQTHRRATAPLYLATGLIASLYTDDRPPARLLRGALLGAAGRLPLFRRLVAAHLTRGAGLV